MKTIAYPCFLLLLCISASLHAQHSSTPNRDVRRLDEKELNAELKGDTAVLFSLWSADYVVNNPNNMIMTAAQIKAFIRKGGIAKTSYTRDIEKLTLTKNLAIVMGSETLPASTNKNQGGKDITRRFTHVWIKTDTSWQLAARQASNMIIP